MGVSSMIWCKVIVSGRQLVHIICPTAMQTYDGKLQLHHQGQRQETAAGQQHPGPHHGTCRINAWVYTYGCIMIMAHTQLKCKLNETSAGAAGAVDVGCCGHLWHFLQQAERPAGVYCQMSSNAALDLVCMFFRAALQLSFLVCWC